jgi:hypothetical protein
MVASIFWNGSKVEQTRFLPANLHDMQQPTSGQCGTVPVLSWLKDHDLLGPIQDLWNAACHCEGLDALDWLVNNGYSVDPYAIITFSSMHP